MYSVPSSLGERMWTLVAHTPPDSVTLDPSSDGMGCSPCHQRKILKVSHSWSVGPSSFSFHSFSDKVYANVSVAFLLLKRVAALPICSAVAHAVHSFKQLQGFFLWFGCLSRRVVVLAKGFM